MDRIPDLTSLKYNSDGLIPAISQQFNDGQVLMMAWMSRETIEESLRTGIACYWSRSRQKFWKKGETSGHIQKIKAIRIDCDRDTLLLLVDQIGVACHTGRKNCFYLEAVPGGWQEIASPELDSETIYGKK